MSQESIALEDVSVIAVQEQSKFRIKRSPILPMFQDFKNSKLIKMIKSLFKPKRRPKSRPIYKEPYTEEAQSYVTHTYGNTVAPTTPKYVGHYTYKYKYFIRLLLISIHLKLKIISTYHNFQYDNSQLTIFQG